MRANQVVLLGDQCQLPPTTSSEDAKKQNVELSLFERLLRGGVRPYMLEEQYRMHPTIAAFIRRRMNT